MKIVDLDEDRQPLYFACLEDWSDEIKEAGNHKERWYHRMQNRGLRVKLALNDQDTVGGMIQYVPIEHSFVEGSYLYVINCIWVHGHHQGRGNFQHRGMGKALLEAAEADARELGAKGIVAWGLLIPVFMRASWFRKHGYRSVDRVGMQVLLWKPFTSDAVPPRWIRQTFKPSLEPDKVTITAFRNGWCPAQNIVFERVRRASAEPAFKDKIVFHEVDTLDRADMLRFGFADALFVNGKQVRTGPPPSYEKIKRIIGRQARNIPSTRRKNDV